jgi:hypothetical protein
MPYPELTQTLYLLTGEVVTEPTSTIKNILTIENYTHTGTVFLVPQTNLNNKKRTNYLNSYEVFNSTGRRDNNLSVRDISLSSSYNEVVISGENKDVTAYARIKNKNIFAVKFSAPGGKRTDSVKNTDLESGEYSSNNSINFRNYEARYTQSIDLQQHTDLNYTSTYTTHKTNRNHRYLVNSSDVIYSKSDNGYVSHQLPYHKDQISWAYKLYNNDAERRNHYVVNNIQTGSEFYITLSFDGTDLSQSFGSDYKLIYGNSSWTQVRASQNWKIRKLRQNSYFIKNSTETTQEGRGTRLDPLLLISSGSLDTSSEGKIIFKEPVVDFCPTYTQINYNDQYIIDNTLYNSKFYNDELNNKNNINQDQQEDVLDYFSDSDKSIKKYKKQIFPQAKISGLNRTRSRENFVYRPWRDEYFSVSADGYTASLHYDNVRGVTDPNYKGYTIPSLFQSDGSPEDGKISGSIWPLDSYRYNYYEPPPPLGNAYSSASNRVLGELLLFYNYIYAGGINQVSSPEYPCVAYSLNSFQTYNSELPWTAFIRANSKPFDDNNKKFEEDIIKLYKNYSTLSEYNLSQQITNDNFEKISEISKNNSFNFYNTGSNINFNSDNITIKDKLSFSINSVLKLRPYQNFYPVFQSMNCASILSSSLSKISSFNFKENGQLNGVNWMCHPFFAPGILYNSIKAGAPMPFAYSATPGELNTASFESIFDVQSYLKNKSINEFLITESFNSNFYKNCINNFLSEIKYTFCKNNSLEYFTSKNEDEFPVFQNGKEYVLDIFVEQGRLDYINNLIIGGINYTDKLSFGNTKNVPLWTYLYGSSSAINPIKAAMTRVSFTPSSTRKYTIDEIFANLVITTPASHTSSYEPFGFDINEYHKITESFNILEKELNEDGISKWKIKSKWEFPYLIMTESFLSFKTAHGISYSPPTMAPSLVSRKNVDGYYVGGLWHDFCEIPNSEQGLFVKISDLDYQSTDQSIQIKSASLADMVGFKKETKRIGELNEQKEISELICIVPVNKNNNSFIKIDQTFDLYQENQKYLKKYILPPKLDYLLDGIDPVIMFCKEVTDIWSKRDLSYIWQNLLPQNGLNHKHKSEKYEVADQKAIELLKNKEVYFMIFKCKLRSVTNPHGTYGYNWPYDECSLIELAQIEAITEE